MGWASGRTSRAWWCVAPSSVAARSGWGALGARVRDLPEEAAALEPIFPPCWIHEALEFENEKTWALVDTPTASMIQGPPSLRGGRPKPETLSSLA